jgi:hypothetical protein
MNREKTPNNRGRFFDHDGDFRHFAEHYGLELA